MDWFTDNKVAWMLVLFVGILYWAFRPRFKGRSRGQSEENKMDET